MHLRTIRRCQRILWIIFTFLAVAVMLRHNARTRSQNALAVRLERARVEEQLKHHQTTDTSAVTHRSLTRRKVVSTQQHQPYIRCSARDLGLFTVVNNTVPKHGRARSKDECLQKCFNRDFAYAGFTMRKTCYCLNWIKYLITDSTMDVADSLELAPMQDAEYQVRIFQKTLGCFTEFPYELAQKIRIGCIPAPTIHESMYAWMLKTMTAQECILHCEKHQHAAAIPIKKSSTCICSDLLSTFGSPENMYQSMQACVDEAEMLQGKLVEVYQTFAVDKYCGPIGFLRPRRKDATLLTSQTGSGNTWLRHLIEVATGVYTGSNAHDTRLVRGGFLGEGMQPSSGRVVAVKNHLFDRKIDPHYTSAITLIRNLYDSTLADFAREKSKSHVEVIKPSLYATREFRKFADVRARIWPSVQQLVLSKFSRVLVVYYEDIQADPVRQLRRIVDFLPPNITPKGAELERRLMCMNLDLKGNFKRPAKNLDFEPYDEHLRSSFHKSMHKMDDLLKRYGQPTLPQYYYRKEQ